MNLGRAADALRGDFANVRPRLLLATLLTAPLPLTVGGRLRAEILRVLGFRLGRGVAFSGMPRFFGEGPIHRHLHVGCNCWFNVGCALELGGKITFGDNVSIGPDVMILTTTHSIGGPEHRCGPQEIQPVQVGDGVWLGARVVVLPGVTVGAGAVVAAGSVVNRDVPANSLVAGVPAKVIRELDNPNSQHAVRDRQGLASICKNAAQVEFVSTFAGKPHDT